MLGILISRSSQTFWARSGIAAVHLMPLTSSLIFSWNAFHSGEFGSVSFSGSAKISRTVGPESAAASPLMSSATALTFTSSAAASAFASLVKLSAFASSAIASPFRFDQASFRRLESIPAASYVGIEGHLEIYRQRLFSSHAGNAGIDTRDEFRTREKEITHGLVRQKDHQQCEQEILPPLTKPAIRTAESRSWSRRDGG